MAETCDLPECPLKTPESRHELEEEIAEVIVPRRWVKITGWVVGVFVVVASAFVVYNWYGMKEYVAEHFAKLDTRVTKIEEFVGDQKGVNARRDIAMTEMASDIREIKELLKTRDTDTDRQVRENARMLEKVMRKLGAQ